MKRFLVVAAALSLGISGVLPGTSRDQAGASAAPDATSSLHDRAKLAGGRLTEVLPDEGDSVCATVEELAGRSPVVVIGKALGVRAHLAPDGDRVMTDVAFKVQEAVKGDVTPGSIITVSMPGGSHRFADGTIARQYVWGYHRVQNQASYLFFLQESPTRTIIRGAVAYELALGQQGQFELNYETDAVTPAAGEAFHPIGVRYRGRSVRDLLVELHAAVPRTR